MLASPSRTRRLLVIGAVVLLGVAAPVLYQMFAPLCCAPAPIGIERWMAEQRARER